MRTRFWLTFRLLADRFFSGLGVRQMPRGGLPRLSGAALYHASN